MVNSQLCGKSPDRSGIALLFYYPFFFNCHNRKIITIIIRKKVKFAISKFNIFKMENNIDLNEQEQNRRDAVVKLRELGIEPYPAALYEVR